LRILKKRILRRIFGSEMDEMTRGYRKLRNEELHSLYVSPSINRIIKGRRMRQAGHVLQGLITLVN
jgi:hypothetical protein